MSFIKSCYGNIGKWRSTMFTWPPVVLFIYLQSFTTLPLTVKIVGEIVVPFELENAVSNYPPRFFATYTNITFSHCISELMLNYRYVVYETIHLYFTYKLEQLNPPRFFALRVSLLLTRTEHCSDPSPRCLCWGYLGWVTSIPRQTVIFDELFGVILSL